MNEISLASVGVPKLRRFPKLPKNVEELAHWYMRYVSPLALLAALLFDYFVLLRRVDLWTTNAVFFFYLAVAASSIVLMNLIEAGRLRRAWILKATPLIPVVAQFAFGGLFAGYLSLYSRSAALEVSWLFVLILAVLLVGNERFVRLYSRFVFQFNILFVVLFSFLIFFLPVISGNVGPYMFLVSGVASLAVVAGFYYFLSYLVPERALGERTRVARSVAVIFVTFNMLYFTGAIPPLPLALKEAGVYHGAARLEGKYQLLAEPRSWYESYLRYNTVFHRAPEESAYVYTAVFAPSGLTMTIFHEWQHYDERARTWVTEETVPFSIIGGRDGGYRGYSVKTNPAAGAWRVNVVTEFQQLIGRVSFDVVDVQAPVPVEIVIR